MTPTYTFDRTTSGAVKQVKTVGAVDLADYYINPTNLHVSNNAGLVSINEDIGRRIFECRADQITSINGTPFAGDTDDAVETLAEEVFTTTP